MRVFWKLGALALAIALFFAASAVIQACAASTASTATYTLKGAPR